MLNNHHIRNALNYAFLKEKPHRIAIDQFKWQATKLLNSINDNESEEFHKNSLSDFLKDSYYKNKHYINTKQRNDLVIHNGKNAESSVGIIIETKSPLNKAEMLSCDNLNKKALQELLLYYLRERISHKNLQLKHLIVTNINEWFIFDARIFERCFAENKTLLKLFTDFEAGVLAGYKTEAFYNDIAAPAIEACKTLLEFSYFNLQDYTAILQSDNKETDNKLIPLFKILSPEHLLKLPFSNDSNSLNQAFYNELLHIIGLTEVKENGKYLIKRQAKSKRHFASLLEQSINEIESLTKRERLPNLSQFGATSEDQLFAIAIELCITWINRILFLKLLEGQLLTYHQQDHEYAFLNSDKINCFSDLNHLFFQVLAKKPEQRSEQLSQLFPHVPYLNSSLFELTELEDRTLVISHLSRLHLPILPTSVLKNTQGKKRSGELDVLSYLFEFLEAYDFASDGKEAIQEHNKTLISASVLGLIFEKINGYQDGSFFTPSIITMYMSREVMRQVVLQKFNTVKNWQCQNFAELHNKIADSNEANAIINSLKICDPAVGSGHFLVSILNEIIAIKSELNILMDKHGKLLKNIHYKIVVANDDLLISDSDNGELFEYNPNNTEKQRVQETLFHEKQTLIENCLFGVDINPNSVKICRLRLWIELLKHAYYIQNEKPVARQLETLPNIDINIQCGNSIISRFPLDVDLKTILQKTEVAMDDYKQAFSIYRHTRDRQEKRKAIDYIEKIKSNFRVEISNNDPKLKRLHSLQSELVILTRQNLIFEETACENKLRDKQVKTLTADIAKLSADIEEVRTNKIYQNAFEWRFEFPEVLNNDGDFVGFDAVIGNPPYIFARNSQEKGFTQASKSHYYNHFELAEYQVNLYPLFIELGYRLLKENGTFSYITPNNWLTINSNKKLRQFVLKQSNIKLVNFHAKVFDKAAVDSAIVLFKKSYENHHVELIEYTDSFTTIKQAVAEDFLIKKDFLINIDSFKNSHALALLDKIELNTIPLHSIADVKVGLKSYQIGKGHPLQTPEIKNNRVFHSKVKLDESYFKYFEGKDICRYFTGWSGDFLKYGAHLAEPRNNFDLFSTKRILVRQIPSKLPYCVNACLIEEIALNDFNSMNIINIKETPELILAVLNSKLMSYWFVHKFGKMQRDTFPQFKVNELATFPMPKTFAPHRDNLITLVKQIMAAKQLNENTQALETQVDTLIYALYALSPEEMAIVEKGKK